MKDLLGKAIYDYHLGKDTGILYTETSISETEEMDVSYFFRPFKDMPELEQKALQLAKGKILDIGCGAGSHALYLQDERELEVKAIDISPLSVKTASSRGVKNAECIDLFELEEQQYDTVLLLMNGSGILGSYEGLYTGLNKLRSLIAPGGQALIDSSDLIYMFDEDEDGGKWVPGDQYYGQLEFTITYDDESETFPWLYIDFDSLAQACAHCGLYCEMILEGENYDYLARITAAI
ncbi:class I SAM-dependent methyltransferase [Robertkochia solimangrovi]|uniref:class I SAM-dependent methyltransferase n=1 Tax=Robertkochia solimangrovi TaxID=2213046 RepID=UPI00117DAAA4|nr:class I SAM-dependent methyltransferase [Robertkochia solimangrovi]TRZ42026.1 SAM-dependent methyltransferase [Robertkochia solimangrovi]